MEKHIEDSFPDLKMLDYQVNYENHEAFSDSGKRRRKAGSPVRIFTNLPLKLFNLSGILGYKFCNHCGIWVGCWNKHCNECEACTSKNGSTYVHCFQCKRCVKPSYKHCVTCKRCCLAGHVCGDFQPDTSCYHCHVQGHKRSQCPLLLEADSSSEKKKKKRKK